MVSPMSRVEELLSLSELPHEIQNISEHTHWCLSIQSCRYKEGAFRHLESDAHPLQDQGLSRFQVKISGVNSKVPLLICEERTSKTGTRTLTFPLTSSDPSFPTSRVYVTSLPAGADVTEAVCCTILRSVQVVGSTRSTKIRPG